MWRKFTTIGLATIVVLALQPVVRAEAATVANGGFETGNFTGWTSTNTCQNNGSWFVYQGTATPGSGTPVSAPPEGTFGAVTDQFQIGTHVLYQDLALEPGFSHQLSMSLYYRNLGARFVTPDTLSCTGQANQQYRVDVLTTTAALDSVAPGDVLASLFRTEVGAPNTLAPTPMTFDLSAFAGQTVRLRFAEVDNGGTFKAAVDNVVLTSTPLPHDLTFFLHGNDIPGTAGGFTMNQTPGPSQVLSVNLLSAPSWFSDPTLTGTYQPGATFRVKLPCTLGIGIAVTFSLAATDPSGGSAQPLGHTTQTLSLCIGSQTITIPVTAPITLTNQRLRLTMSSVLSVVLNLNLGTNSFLHTTQFAGTP